MPITKTTSGILFSETWDDGTYDQWNKNVHGSITDTISGGAETITYEPGDYSWHCAKTITSIPTNCILVARVSATASTDLYSSAELKRGQVGIGFVASGANYPCADIQLEDMTAAAIALYAAGHTYTNEVLSGLLVNGQVYKLKIVKSGANYSYYVDGALIGSLSYSAAVDRIAIMAYRTPGSYFFSSGTIDNIAFYPSESITLTGLVAGQKVELYRTSDNVKIDTQTVAGDKTSVTLNGASETFPENLYFMVYGTDGTTLLNTTASYSMCGGDSWAWMAPVATGLMVASPQRIIYRTAAVADPKSANITATLLQLNGDPYVGKTVLLSTSLGSLTSASGVTDASGNVTTQLTGLTHGPAVVHAYYAGDGVVPPCDELIADLQAADWTVGTGWAAPAGTLNKNADGTGTAAPTEALYIVAGTMYKVVITLSACTVGSCSYTLGGTAGTHILDSASTFTHYITATTANVSGNDELITQTLLAADWTVGTGWAAPAGTLNKNADGTGTAAPTTPLSIEVGKLYKVVITLSACTVGSCSYTLGGVTGTVLSSATTYTDFITATSTGNLIFTPSASNSRFTISAVSVKEVSSNLVFTPSALNSRFTISAVSVKEILAADAYVTVHIFDEAEAPDASKDFQFYCEGIEYPYISGSYALNNEGITEGFEVEVDQWYNTFAFFGLVSIYRLGVKEYAGTLLGASRSLGTNPTVKLNGSDLSRLLSLRLVNYELYTSKTPLDIVSSLLSKYPCGLSTGVLNDTLIATIEFDSVNLTEALTNLCDMLGLTMRINDDMTVDMDTSFGETQIVAFTEGTNIIRGELTVS